jgi:RNA polymerase sigma-70 factor (ECF subfamily)
MQSHASVIGWAQFEGRSPRVRVVLDVGRPAAIVQRVPVSRTIPTPPSRDRADAARTVEELVPTLQIIARRLYRDRADAEDLVQDAVERALRALDQMDPLANPRGWVVTILHNLHIDRCRRRSRLAPHLPAHDLSLAAEEPASEPSWANIGVDELRDAVGRLSPELAAAYRMFALEGRSYIEVSAALGIPKATVGTRLVRARAQLKELLLGRLEGK